MKTHLAVAALALMAMVAGTWAAYEADQAQYWRKQYDAVKPRRLPCPDLGTLASPPTTRTTIECATTTPKCWNIISSGAAASTTISNPDLQEQLDEARAETQAKINEVAAILKSREHDEAFLLKAICEHFRQEHNTILPGCHPLPTVKK